MNKNREEVRFQSSSTLLKGSARDNKKPENGEYIDYFVLGDFSSFKINGSKTRSRVGVISGYFKTWTHYPPPRMNIRRRRYLKHANKQTNAWQTWECQKNKCYRLLWKARAFAFACYYSSSAPFPPGFLSRIRQAQTKKLTFSCLNGESKTVILASGQWEQDYLARQIYI